MLYESISPTELNERLKNGEKVNLIDVREVWEYELAHLESAKLLPLSRFNEWIGELKPEEETVVMCHHGIRSANVCLFLLRNGFEKVFNLDGGIDLWSKEVDAEVPRY
jgi:rhodanese-related sulfurtransferase